MKREKEVQEQGCRDCAGRTRRIIERDCVACGEGVSVEDKTTSLVGMDAVALFPSMSGETTARIVSKRIEKSSLKFEGFNWKKAGIYILANRKLISHMDREVKKYLPVRRKTGGVEPGMSSAGLKNKEDREENQWYYHKKNPPEEVKKKMVGMVAEIGIKILWSTYCYDFGGQNHDARLFRGL